MLALDLNKSNFLTVTVFTIHVIALVAAMLNSAPLWLRLLMVALISLLWLIGYRQLTSSNEITRLHFQEQSMQICLNYQSWVEVDMTVRRCDRLFVVLVLTCIDSHSHYVGKRWLLCFYPWRLSDEQQRNLRRFIRFG